MNAVTAIHQAVPYVTRLVDAGIDVIDVDFYSAGIYGVDAPSILLSGGAEQWARAIALLHLVDLSGEENGAGSMIVRGRTIDGVQVTACWRVATEVAA